jgi:hypothetical protein
MVSLTTFIVKDDPRLFSAEFILPGYIATPTDNWEAVWQSTGRISTRCTPFEITSKRL